MIRVICLCYDVARNRNLSVQTASFRYLQLFYGMKGLTKVLSQSSPKTDEPFYALKVLK